MANDFKPSAKPLELFNRWFTSAIGVYQTIFLVAAVVIFEFYRPDVDPHGFWVLYWLTVYSGATQPMLAYISAKSAAKTDQILDRIEDMLSDEAVVDDKTLFTAEKILSKLDPVRDTEN